MRIVFLLPVVSHARYHKRVGALCALGAAPQILAFEREYYPGNPWPNGYISLGYLQHGNFHQRLIPILKALFRIRTEVSRTDVIYAFGLDMLFLGVLSSLTSRNRPKVVYEVADIHPTLLGNGAIARLLRWGERCLLRHVTVLVVTSEAYITSYFQGIQGLSDLRYKVIENKLDIEQFPSLPTVMGTFSRNKPETLRIGYFGLIRCRRSWQVLRELAKCGQGRIRIYMRGVLRLTESENQEIRNTEFVEYGGPYVYPDDLPFMYGQVDLIWIANYLSQGHVNWSRVNRFYEACYFARPMIAQINTQDGLVVDKFDLGQCIDLLDIEDAVDSILRIDQEQLEVWGRNLSTIPKDICVYTNEHDELIEMMR